LIKMFLRYETAHPLRFVMSHLQTKIRPRGVNSIRQPARNLFVFIIF
jgi:hypothetical protein